MKKISLIVPVYNASGYLHYCLESVTNQIYRNFELILVDDGSKDTSGQLCDAFAEQKHDFSVRVIHKENGGVSSARNAGIQYADSEYIAFLDSDDYLEPDYLSVLIQIREKYPEAGHIWCGFQLVSDYQKGNAKQYFLQNEKDVSFYDRSDYMTLYENWMVQGPYCKLYKTDIVKTIFFDTKLSLGEDTLFNMEYLDQVRQTGIVFINRSCYNYIQCTDHSLYSKYRDDLFDIFLKINSELKMKISDWHLSEDAWKIYNTQVFHNTVNAMNNTLRPENTMCFFYKMHRNSTIMKDSQFQESLKEIDFYVNPHILKAYRSGSYFMVWVLEKLATLKRH